MSESVYPHLEAALSAKGIGPKGLKPLPKEDYEGLFRELNNGAPEPLVAAFLMGFQVLEHDELERAYLLEAYKSQSPRCSPELKFLLEPFSHSPSVEVEFWIQSLVKGEELSEDICKKLIAFLLDPCEKDIYKVALLQGLRVKRESDGENEHLLRALCALAPRRKVPLTQLIDLSFPYDGMTRNDDISLELLAMLSMMGQHVVIHGVKFLGPKFGSVILDQIDESVKCDFDRAEQGLKTAGVAILDQACIFPELQSLLPLRNAMKKRPFLATMEKMLQPLRAERNIIVTGYVHSAYRDSIPEMLSKVGLYEQILLVKGLEGSVVLDPYKKQSLFLRQQTSIEELDLPRWEAPLVLEKDPTVNWWRNSAHVKTKTLLFTAGTILQVVLGDRQLDVIVHTMQNKLDSGLLEKQLELIYQIYPMIKSK